MKHQSVSFGLTLTSVCIFKLLSLFFLLFRGFLKIYLFLAVLGLHCRTGFSLVVVCKLLIMVASLVAEHEL